jgi:hypothetical protein
MHRLLGDTERAVWLLDRAGSLNAAIRARVVGPLDPDLLRRALDALQAARPLLRVRVERGELPAFSSDGVPRIPLRCVAGGEEDRWSAELEDELNLGFAWERGPLIRATLIRGQGSSDLLFTLHHAIVDGAALNYVVRDVLQTAAALLVGGPVPAPTPVRPPLEVLLPPEGHGLAALRGAARSAARHLAGAVQRPARLPPDGAAPPGLRRTRVLALELDPAEASALSRRCRAEGVTVHGALVAALLQSVRAQLDLDEAPRLLSCASPVSLRRYLASPLDAEIGMFMSAVLLALPVSASGDPWALARRAKAALGAAIERGEHFAAIRLQGLLRAAASDPERFAWAAEALFPAAAAVTNFGRADISACYGPLALQALDASVAVNVVSGGSACLCANTFADRSSLLFVGAEPLLSRARLAELAAATVRRLRAAL